MSIASLPTQLLLGRHTAAPPSVSLPICARHLRSPRRTYLLMFYVSRVEQRSRSTGRLRRTCSCARAQSEVASRRGKYDLIGPSLQPWHAGSAMGGCCASGGSGRQMHPRRTAVAPCTLSAGVGDEEGETNMPEVAASSQRTTCQTPVPCTVARPSESDLDLCFHSAAAAIYIWQTSGRPGAVPRLRVVGRRGHWQHDESGHWQRRQLGVAPRSSRSTKY